MNWSEGIPPAIINDNVRSMMARVAEWRDDTSGSLTTAGTSTAYTLTTNEGLNTPTPTTGQLVAFMPHVTNGVSPTLAVDGGSNYPIQQSPGVAVAASFLVLGSPYTAMFNGTAWILRDVPGVFGAATFGGAATFNSTATFNAGATLVSTAAGAGVGPTLDLFRDKAASAGDFIGAVDLYGRDSASNKQLYGRLTAQINDPTNGSEDATLYLQQMVAGALAVVMQSFGGDINIPGNLLVTGNITGKNPTVQRLTSGAGATYTPTVGTVRIRVRMVGPGGGGGGRTANTGSNGSAATSFQVNSTGTPWTVGPGLGGGPSGGSGGDNGTGGTNGSTGTLIVRMVGGQGGAGGTTTTAGTIQVGGFGGATPFGIGPSAQLSVPAAPPANSGAGGGGAGGASGTAAGSGGGGGEYVEFWVTGITTATYTVGAGGAGGAAGGVAGRDGAAGIIIIEEFYS